MWCACSLPIKYLENAHPDVGDETKAPQHEGGEADSPVLVLCARNPLPPHPPDVFTTCWMFSMTSNRSFHMSQRCTSTAYSVMPSIAVQYQSEERRQVRAHAARLAQATAGTVPGQPFLLSPTRFRTCDSTNCMSPLHATTINRESMIGEIVGLWAGPGHSAEGPAPRRCAQSPV